MKFRINIDSHKKKQRSTVTTSVVCSHLILAYTVRLAIINAAELERNGCFSLAFLRNVVL